MAEPATCGGFFPLQTCVSTRAENSRTGHLNCATGYYNARSAIWSLISSNAIRDVLLPRYICPVVFGAVEQAGAEGRFYNVRPDLTFDYAELERLSADCSLLVVPSYFGVIMPDLGALRCVRRRTGCRVLLDYAQALYEPCPRDFAAVYSPRKFLGVPDGGFLTVGCDSGLDAPGEPETKVDPSIFGDRLSCHGIRLEYPGAACLEAFRALENGMPFGQIRMSDLAAGIFAAFDHDSACARRIENYETLAELLGEPLARHSSVPLCFPLPIRPERFDSVRRDLIEQGIFIPYYWPGNNEWMKPGKGVLAFPVDHRYDKADMAAVSERAMAVLHERQG